MLILIFYILSQNTARLTVSQTGPGWGELSEGRNLIIMRKLGKTSLQLEEANISENTIMASWRAGNGLSSNRWIPVFARPLLVWMTSPACRYFSSQLTWPGLVGSKLWSCESAERRDLSWELTPLPPPSHPPQLTWSIFLRFISNQSNSSFNRYLDHPRVRVYEWNSSKFWHGGTTLLQRCYNQ